MKKITSIQIGRGRGKRVNISLDGRFALSLEAEVAVKAGLKVGQELSDEQIEILAKSDYFHRCLNVAARYLSYRPRSEFELRERLSKRGFNGDTVEAVLARLKEQGLVNDADFVHFWKQNRESFSPRSRWLTNLELKRKGVAEEIISQVGGVIDDDESAYRAALKKIRSLHPSDYKDFRRQLGTYLRRRGFSYEVINRTLESLWQRVI